MEGEDWWRPPRRSFPLRTTQKKLRSLVLESSWSALAFLVVVVAGVRQRARHKKAGEVRLIAGDGGWVAAASELLLLQLAQAHSGFQEARARGKFSAFLVVVCSAPGNGS